MKRSIWILLLALAGCASLAPGGTPPGRTVAVTVDDLPWARGDAFAEPRLAELTARLVGQLEAAGIPAVGFVNEGKLERAPTRTALLERWTAAGLELGNHTYSHRSFYTTPRDTFQADVLRGEPVTRRLMAARGMRLRYFRHPFLNTGPDLATREAFERFLDERGYQVAPVTVDNSDYLYALAYDRAVTRGDSAAMKRIGEEYVRAMDASFAYYEDLSRRLLGREPAQILLLHANELNAEYMDEVAAMMRRRGYRFATLEAALRDPAYAQPDRYAGRSGMSWLQRWAITRGVPLGSEPAVAEWVQEATRAPR